MNISTEPHLTIITVVYNGAKTIRRTIESVLSLNLRDIEYLIIDGKSTDDTLDIIKEYGDKIKFLSEVDAGIYDAMNKGVALASGKFVYFLGADDVLLPEFRKMYERLIPGVISYGNVRYKKSGKIYDGEFFTFKIISKNIHHQSIIYPISVFKKYKYNLRYKIFADYYLNILCWNDKEFQFQYIPATVAEFDDSGVSSQNSDKVFLAEQIRIFSKAMPIYYLPYIYLRKSLGWIKRNYLE